MRIACGFWTPACAGEQGLLTAGIRSSPKPYPLSTVPQPAPFDLYDILIPPPGFRPRTFTACAPSYRPDAALPRPLGLFFMSDLLWLAVLAGLFLLSLAFVRLCDAA